jgi:hypothetical protein
MNRKAAERLEDNSEAGGQRVTRVDQPGPQGPGHRARIKRAVSTADDLWAFASMLAAGGGSLLSAESVALMTHDRMTAKDRAENRIFVGDHSGCFRFVRAATADQAGTGRFASDQ